MARVKITFTGLSPLVCHNIRLADPDDPIVRDIAAITGKRKKTEDDRKRIGELEWYGGLYTDPTIPGPVMPTANIRKCIIQAAKINRLGTAVQRAVHFADLNVPLIYEGPRDLSQLGERAEFVYRTSVGVGQKRVIRVRPVFPRWTITAQAELIEEIMDIDDFQRVVQRAGIVEGLGDNRVNGYGRFEGSVAL